MRGKLCWCSLAVYHRTRLEFLSPTCHHSRVRQWASSIYIKKALRKEKKLSYSCSSQQGWSHNWGNATTGHMPSQTYNASIHRPSKSPAGRVVRLFEESSLAISRAAKNGGGKSASNFASVRRAFTLYSQALVDDETSLSSNDARLAKGHLYDAGCR